MNDCKSYRLGDLCERITKGTTPTTLGKAFVEHGINFVKAESLSGNGGFNWDKFAQIDLDTHMLLKRSQLEVDDVLFTIAGTIGRTAIVKKEILPANTNQAVAILKPLKSIISPIFLKYALQSNMIQEIMTSKIVHAVQPNLSLGEISSVEILLPPLPKQCAITEVLSSLDDKIDLLRRQNKTLEEMAETLFRQWFVEEAEQTQLSHYAKIQNGYAFKSNDFTDTGDYGVIKITNVSFDSIDINNTQFISNNIASGLKEKFSISTGDFLIAMTGAEIGKIGITGKSNKKLLLNQRVGMLVDVIEKGKLIAYMILKSQDGQEHILNTATGSAQPNISASGIESMTVPLISNHTAKLITKTLDPVFEKKVNNLSQIQQLETLRDILLPKLMNGTVTVNES